MTLRQGGSVLEDIREYWSGVVQRTSEESAVPRARACESEESPAGRGVCQIKPDQAATAPRPSGQT